VGTLVAGGGFPGGHLVAALVIALLVFCAALALWIWVARPREHRIQATLVELDESRSQLRSLFQENPDAIVMFGLDGRVRRGNAATVRLLHPFPTMVGQHLSEYVAPEDFAQGYAAFTRAANGANVAFETRFIDAEGRPIEVQLSLFPDVVNGKIAGVVGVAKDLRPLKAAQASAIEQSARIAQLASVAASHGRSAGHQIRDAIELAARQLGYEWSFVAELGEGEMAAVTIAGEPRGLMLGDRVPALLRDVLRSGNVWQLDDVASFREANGADGIPEWGSVAGISLEVGATAYGIFCIGSSTARTTPLAREDRDFVRLVGALLAATVERGRYEERLDALAFSDALTGLANRVVLLDRLGQLTSSRTTAPFALHYLDLDRFKAINDGFGHAVGDVVLREAARRIKSCVRESDTVARVGGDEFVILQPNPHPRAGAGELATRLLDTIAAPFVIEGATHQLDLSIGISMHPDNGSDGQLLLRCADEALYAAKRHGRGRYEFFESPSAATTKVAER
jgi:diguanylate cyclase (GGDEF)-like protein/PAS domain S-box-containing protein